MMNYITPQCKDPELMPYAQKLHSILNKSLSFPDGATRIYDHLYLGGYCEATDHRIIKNLGITHVINCAAKDINTGLDFYREDDVRRYVGFKADDADWYEMMQHYDEAEAVIEDARETNGRALIHCQMGVNRSGVLTVAYVMMRDKCGPLTAAEKVLKARQHLLSNSAFQVQILEWANKRGMLALDSDKVSKVNDKK